MRFRPVIVSININNNNQQLTPPAPPICPRPAYMSSSSLLISACTS